jgi:thiol-disulfide isomerase/thioredoxin
MMLSSAICYQLSGQKGKWVLVNFWAPWCPSCLAELPDLNSLQLRHDDLLVIGIAVQAKSKQDVLDTMVKQSLSYPIVFGNEDIAADFGGLEGLPTSFLYSPAGKLVNRIDGPITLSDIEMLISPKAQ